ncbi:type II toxin-antitoxin system Phd/YefM family antitoxin [Kocuria sp.]|uniref:type II toxin-antitoxin system Phd/YefM family antitoxin n=1 Tax=Kocuria sp. TaxID=1871328 RepID=UPI0026E0C1E8|nr:type II toxin-antitoxin system prevent-host-death family antitoxin [Kocuria sp.]MDO5617848.1 type II toxin-antitoxin system prevent-host-death family antitoxin [Kocuria sp.]
MATVTRSELNQQTARVLARVEAGEDVTVTDRGRPIARISPVESSRRSQRIAAGLLRPASASGVPEIKVPVTDWSTEQMLEDMRGES